MLPENISSPKIVVVGSLNVDLVVQVERFARPGETLPAKGFQTFIGGKGFNQGIAAARQGGAVSIVGRVGDDQFGVMLREVAAREGIGAEQLIVTAGVSSGVALIAVDDAAENAIMYVAGANGKVTPEDVIAAESLIRSADLVLAQLEIPLQAVMKAAELAKAAGVTMMLVPAPARPLPAELLRNVDVIVANREEVSMVLDEATYEPETDARRLLAKGPHTVVVTLGGRGALAVRAGQPTLSVPAFPVEAVDTTGAGDAFSGGLAVALAAKLPLDQALRRAAACGALACTVMGAEPSLPQRAAVDELLRKHASA